MAPIALYPDPLLSVILQASTLPLQVIQAERFLDKRAEDPSLAPDPDWDPSILALVNYPQLVQAMSEYIDWTEELGNAVLDRLEDVQVAIQEIRWGSYTQGILKSDEALEVTAEGNVIAIEPARVVWAMGGGADGTGRPGGPRGRQESAALPAAGARARRDVGSRVRRRAAPRQLRHPAGFARRAARGCAGHSPEPAGGEPRAVPEGPGSEPRPGRGAAGQRTGSLAGRKSRRRGAGQARRQEPGRWRR